ncbi:galactoside alpha-(1,2)-fucosyltransferase 2-like [Amphibalanus amphitrite]|uniref:galactoside alpha-(1,2)-fucosyltransferase 2-like n=1 Tax=Amphibalanus amphitrite TaxID=1232801 RepID=UPI001C902A89|nr:galactoside alpha-(1,2)-fucosyltransferase 2-like [Amphibalanus amphitrite]
MWTVSGERRPVTGRAMPVLGGRQGLRRLTAGLTLVLTCVLLMQSAHRQHPRWVSTEQRGGTEEDQQAGEGPTSVSDVLLRLCPPLHGHVDSSDVPANVQHVLRWACLQLEKPSPPPATPTGCNKTVSYLPIGRLGNLMGLYAIIYSYSRIYGAAGYVDDKMLTKLTRYFPGLSLPPSSRLPTGVQRHNISYQDAAKYLECEPGEHHSQPQHYLITIYPDRNGIDLFHPFYSELRREFEFSARLQQQAQTFLHYARGKRSTVTFIGVHVRRTDYRAYIETKYKGALPDEEYLSRALDFYRRRYADALFIVCSDELDYVAKQLHVRESKDIVLAGNRNLEDPGRDMALLAACNHSVVTVGTYGFWGAYLAGGTVLAPEQQTHMTMGDRHAPLLEIQLAGADNWVALR